MNAAIQFRLVEEGERHRWVIRVGYFPELEAARAWYKSCFTELERNSSDGFGEQSGRLALYEGRRSMHH